MIASPPAHPPAAASVMSATAANVRLRPHPTGDPPDTLLLARGMSSRYLSSKTEHRLLPLSRANVERNLRHFEAHWSTCGGYAQQRFVHGNGSWPGAGALLVPRSHAPRLIPRSHGPQLVLRLLNTRLIPRSLDKRLVPRSLAHMGRHGKMLRYPRRC